MALSQSSVLRLYINVIEETIQSSREAFLDEGVDEQVLMELKQLWETKITNSKAVKVDPPIEQPDGAASTSNAKRQPVKRNQNDLASNANNLYHQNNQAGTSQIKQQPITNGNAQLPLPGTIPSQAQQIPQQSQQIPQQAPPQQIQMFSNMLDPTKIVPIQITLPPQAGVQESRVLTIQVPATALMGNQLQQVLTGPVISATMGLPQLQASTLLQQHVNALLQGQSSPLLAKAIPQVDGIMSNSTFSGKVNFEIPDIFQLHRALKNSTSKKRSHLKKHKVPQIDGCHSVTGLLEDSSDDDDDVSDEPSEDEELDEEKEDEDPDLDEGGMEEEPLNSEDDVSEEDPTDLFDTENVVVCQYDKINRSRNRWKFYLKDGIMNLNGKDFIFQKITGDAEW